MCGIVGVLGNRISVAQEDAFKKMLILDTIRGKHSTGMFAVALNKEMFTAKKAVEGQTFVDSRAVADIFKGKSFNLLVGHNRHATAGSVTDDNAHPFNYGSTWLVHNGSLKAGWKSTLHKGMDTPVDSEAICYNIEHEGVRRTSAKLEGAFAVVSYNEQLEELTIFRNEERPLYVAATEDQRSVFFASEAWIIEVACGKSNVAIEKPRAVNTLTEIKFNLDLLAQTGHTLATKGVVSMKGGLEEKKSSVSYGRTGTTYGTGTTTSASKRTTDTTKYSKGRLFTDSKFTLPEFDLKRDERIVVQFLSMATSNGSTDISGVPDNGPVYVFGHVIQPLGGVSGQHYDGINSCLPVLKFGATRKRAESLIEGGAYEVSVSNMLDFRKDPHLCIKEPILPLTKEEEELHWDIVYSVVYDSEGEEKSPAKQEASKKKTGTAKSKATKTTKAKKAEAKEEEESNIIHLPAPDKLYRGPDGSNITEERFKELAKSGCGNCGSPVFLNEARTIEWVHNDTPLCTGCSQMVNVAKKKGAGTNEEALEMANVSNQTVH